MRTPSSHITVGPTNKIYGETYNSCEREEYAFMIPLEYLNLVPIMIRYWLWFVLKYIFLSIKFYEIFK